MARIEEHKYLSEHKPIRAAKLPAKVYLPLQQHLGKPCAPVVKKGDSIKAGQIIATLDSGVFAPLHASISGKVTNIDDLPHPILGRAQAIIIETDGSPDIEFRRINTDDEIGKLSAEEIRKVIFDAGIVGLGGATFPTHIKLNPPTKIDSLIINGAECEPYLTSDARLMIERTEEILKGIELSARCLGNPNVYIAIEDNKPEAIKQFELELKDTNYKLKIIKTKYPQGGEKQLIENILGRQVTSGKVPFSIGVVVHNVGTIFAIYEAVYLNKPLIERVVTVTGSCLSNPGNFLVRLGTPIKELINECAPLVKEPSKIIIGGPMMGIAQYTDEVPVIKSTSGIILFNEKEASIFEEESCIRCGGCVRECPVKLMPCLINLSSEKGLWDEARKYAALDCIECGLCNYVCPANRRLVQSIKRAKLELAK